MMMTMTWHILSWKTNQPSSPFCFDDHEKHIFRFFLDRFLFPNFFVSVSVYKCFGKSAKISFWIFFFQEWFVWNFPVFNSELSSKSESLLALSALCRPSPAGDEKTLSREKPQRFFRKNDFRRRDERAKSAKSHRRDDFFFLKSFVCLSHMFLNVFLMYHLDITFFHLKMCHALIILLLSFLSIISSTKKKLKELDNEKKLRLKIFLLLSRVNL